MTGDEGPTIADRRAEGRAARERVARRNLGDWDPTRRQRSALETLRSQEAIRDPGLLPIRYGRMASSPWAYLRGAAAVMAADLATAPHTDLTVQLGGDAHILNFGLWATPERNLNFAVRDFDESVPGPFEWDVLRLAASLVVLARDCGLSEEIATESVLSAAVGYRRQMAAYAGMSELDTWYDHFNAASLVRFLPKSDRNEMRARIAREAERRTSIGAFESLTTVVDGRRVITERPGRRLHFDHESLHQLVSEVLESYRASLPDHVRRLLDRFTITDIVQQVPGVGSVGMLVFLILFEGQSGKAPLFLQMKQAGPSVYEQHLGPAPHGTHGERVVVGQRAMQTAPDPFLGWTTGIRRSYYVRQFRDMKVNPDAQQIMGFLVEFANAASRVLAKSHARTGDAVAISAYLGKGRAWEYGLVDFAHTYADQTERDHADLEAAITDGAVEATAGL